MSRLSAAFQKQPKCFIPFVTAGHPDLETTEEIIVELVAAGSDIVEIGIPFSDPIADGPVIQRSSFQALQHGYSMSDFIHMVGRVRAKTDAGLLFMSYINPLMRYGLERLEEEAARSGLDGLLISDLTPEEYRLMQPLEKLDTVFLAAPTSSDQRLQSIARVSRGFLYLVARTGVTGSHTEVGEEIASTVARLRRYTDTPIAVGFGIDSPEAVQRVWEQAEGAVVGSAIVQFIEEHKGEAELPKQVGRYVRQLIPDVR
ncbi:MAG TPA: tryptophan synthase subunit alpha [Acidobacteriota bacterium]|nr:tryptophan synthase subunit alpha [Acidobacteriota bacterium]